MPLFKAIIKVVAVTEIPIAADSKEKALEYLLSNEEWAEDLDVSDSWDAVSREIKSVSLISNPKQVKWEWHRQPWGDRSDYRVDCNDDVTVFLYEREEQEAFNRYNEADGESYCDNETEKDMIEKLRLDWLSTKEILISRWKEEQSDDHR